MKIPQIDDISSFMNKRQWKDGNMMDIEEMTSEDFVKLISNIGQIYLGNSEKITKVTGRVEIRPENYKLNSLTLKNFEFLDMVSFFGQPEIPVNIGDHLICKDCVFRQPLIFNYCISSDTAESDFRQQGEAIQIINGSYILFQITNCIFPFGVKMYSEEGEKLEIDWFESRHNNFSKAGYDFENVTFKSKLDFIADRIENIGIDFQDCVSSSPIKLSEISAPLVAFTGINSKYEKIIDILLGHFSSIHFNDAIFKSKVTLRAVEIDKTINLIGNNFEDNINVSGKDIPSHRRSLIAPDNIWIQDNKFQNGFKYDSDLMAVNKVSIVFSEKSSGVMEFENSFFGNVNLIGSNFHNSLFFRDCTYEKLTFSNLFNRALISLKNNVPEPSSSKPVELKIENSNLGNTEFYDFDFSVYPIVRIINSRLDNIFVNGVEWFNDHQLKVDDEEGNGLKILSQKREIYRQLKFAAEKQSDRITSLSFKAREIEMHHAVLKKKKYMNDAGLKNKLNRWINRISDLLAIILGYTNQHGQNWIYPLFWILGITTLPFYPLIFMAADPEISFWCLDCNFISLRTLFSKFQDYGSIWPYLFNPARRLNDLFPGVEISFALGFWDGLHRIILTFFIFQIVSAFRKFVK